MSRVLQRWLRDPELLSPGNPPPPSANKGDRHIDPCKCAQAVQLERLRTYASRQEVSWALEALGILLDEDRLDGILAPEFPEGLLSRVGYTDERNRQEVLDLSIKGEVEHPIPGFPPIPTGSVLGERELEETVLAWVRLTFVPKGEQFLRVILNARRVNKAFKKPTRFKLPSVEELISIMFAFEDPNYVVGDFRHWFYQLSTNRRLRRMFGVKCGNLERLLNVVPMGWSWAPRIAQAITMMIVLAREPGEDALGVEDSTYTLADPPCIVHLKQGGEIVGHIAVCLDNILVVTKEKKLADDWQDRLMKKARSVNAQWNPKSTPHVQQTATVFGIFFDGLKKTWQLSPDKARPWGEEKMPSTATRRYWAHLVGGIMWFRRVHRWKLLFWEEGLDILRSLAQHGAGHKSQREITQHWDEMVSMSDEQRRTLQEGLDAMGLNEPEVWVAPAVLPTTYAVSDASGHAWATVWLEQLVEPLQARWDSFAWPFLQMHIFYKELKALLELVERPDFHDVHLVAGVDNTSAIAAVTRGYSLRREGRDLLRRIYGVCARKNIQLELIWIASELNAADDRTRERSTVPRKVEWSLAHLKGELPDEVKAWLHALRNPSPDGESILPLCFFLLLSRTSPTTKERPRLGDGFVALS